MQEKCVLSIDFFSMKSKEWFLRSANQEIPLQIYKLKHAIGQEFITIT
jgi:hypothetical protein